MQNPSEFLDFLLSQANDLRTLLEVLPSGGDIAEIPENLESEIETESGERGWISARSARLCISDVESRVRDSENIASSMLTTVSHQICELFSAYKSVSGLEKEPVGEYEQLLSEMTYRDWKDAVAHMPVEKFLFMAMSTWTPEKAKTLGWYDCVISKLSPQVAVSIVNQASKKTDHQVPAWWGEIAPLLAKPDNKKELDGVLENFVMAQALSPKESFGGWSPKEWYANLKSCGAKLAPQDLRFHAFFDKYDFPVSDSGRVKTHHIRMTAALSRMFELDPAAFRTTFALFCPRISELPETRAEHNFARKYTSVQTEKKAFESLVSDAQKSLIIHNQKDGVDGHALMHVFTQIDKGLSNMLADETLPSYGQMLQELRSKLEVGSRPKVAASRPRLF